jgi:hypothetical protein
MPQYIFRPFQATTDGEASGERFDAVQTPWLAIVNRVGGDKVGNYITRELESHKSS